MKRPAINPNAPQPRSVTIVTKLISIIEYTLDWLATKLVTTTAGIANKNAIPKQEPIFQCNSFQMPMLIQKYAIQVNAIGKPIGRSQ